jgi:hypothetical protein
MACFSLSRKQIGWLTGCIQVGLESSVGISMEDAEPIFALIEELEASDHPIEITVMVDEPARQRERDENHYDTALDALVESARDDNADDAYALYESTGDERLRTVM